ncbi:MAG: UDP-N-acetylmuramoyl-tripeptide--D-alanyl-D-alanine ligase, partial [Planctomycetota bacterium]
MKDLSIAELVRIIKAEAPKQTGTIADVSIDSRKVKPGDCFFAIKGENFDGHDYVADAFAKGASCAVIETEVKAEGLDSKCILRVNDTIEALGDFAREYRRQVGFKVLAITGSVGKTTTRQIAAHALSRRFRVRQSPKSFNNNIGLPLTLLSAGPQTEIVVAELGSNHPGEIAYLTRIALPDIAIVTSVRPAHLEGFGNIETIVREKLSISEGLGPHGIFIINMDLAEACRAVRADFLTFGKSPEADYRASQISSNGLRSRFTIDGTEIHLPLPGAGNVENALAAWAACSRLGLKIEDFAEEVR